MLQVSYESVTDYGKHIVMCNPDAEPCPNFSNGILIKWNERGLPESFSDIFILPEQYEDFYQIFKTLTGR